MEKKGPQSGLFGVFPVIKIHPVSPSLDQKEQNCVGPPQFYVQNKDVDLSKTYQRFILLLKSGNPSIQQNSSCIGTIELKNWGCPKQFCSF